MYSTYMYDSRTCMYTLSPLLLNLLILNYCDSVHVPAASLGVLKGQRGGGGGGANQTLGSGLGNTLTNLLHSNKHIKYYMAYRIDQK